MTFERIYQLLKTNPTVKLIAADNAPLIIGFLFKAFKLTQGTGISDTIAERDIIVALSDYLFLINKDEAIYPKSAKEYLTDWTNSGYLRKYPSKSDEFLYELTSATENAFKWIDSLEKPEFIGTDSRLKILFEKLKELSTKTKRDYETRFNELEKKRVSIEQEIEDLKNGKFDVLDDRQVKERYLFIEETAKFLLADFRQVEENFRLLDRNFRKKIITTSQSKGKVLEELFNQQDFLLETDQGKSFIAFWEFLLSQSRQDEFEMLIDDVLCLPIVQQMQKETFSIDNLRNNLIDAGDKTKKTTNSLLEQLRKYLEHKSFFENKRIHDNITELLKIISENQESDLSKLSLLELDEIVKIDLILDRPLYSPPEKIIFKNGKLEEGVSTSAGDALFEQFEINTAELKAKIKLALRNRATISFTEFITEFQIEKGIAEVVAYVEIATKERNKHIIADETQDIIDIKNSKTGKQFKVKIPQITFCR